jgi:hypothetical protein
LKTKIFYYTLKNVSFLGKKTFEPGRGVGGVGVHQLLKTVFVPPKTALFDFYVGVHMIFMHPTYILAFQLMSQGPIQEYTRLLTGQFFNTSSSLGVTLTPGDEL